MRKIDLFTSALIAGALIFSGALFSFGVNAAEDSLKVRKEGFEATKKSFGAIKKILEEGGDLSGAAASAQSINAFSKQVPALFPAGSDKGETKAKAAVWSNGADFGVKAQAFEAESAKLVQAVASGDKAAVQKQFGAVGGTCKACHDTYRSE
ncbi:cytochrome c [Skermanella aerolata]|uniref:Cytochrome c n=1 Tax=Skermanella aerolata TaxID=393310 RepID=A0A512DRG3_9PROT|nr:cytochrome c [Skermanella aerolata]KJB92518.1 cytochrome C [Skermanella aerolata KACC 11604]GEO39054.1 cytochrome c [Skermanella aerolata]